MSGKKTSGWFTEYAVQPFVLDQRRLKPEQPRPARDRDGALRLGSRLAPLKAGVIVVARRCAPELGEYEDAIVLETHGAIPDELAAAVGA